MVLTRFVDSPVVAGLLAALLLLLPMEMPLLLPLQMIVPLPLLLLSLRKGLQTGWLAAVFPVLAAFSLGGGVQFPLMILLLFIAFPLLAAWLLRAGWRLSHCAGAAFLLGAVVLALGLLLAVLAGVNLEVEVGAVLEVFKTTFLDAVKSSKGIIPADLVTFQQQLDRYFHVLALLFPGLLVSGWFFVQVANLLLAKNLVMRWQLGSFPEEDLTALRLPHMLVWGVIGMAVLALTTSDLWPGEGWNFVSLV